MSDGTAGAARPRRRATPAAAWGTPARPVFKAVAIAVSVAAACSAARAQAPAAGIPSAPRPFVEEQRQLERERALREQQEPDAQVRLQPDAPPADSRLPADGEDQPCVPIARLRLQGDQADTFQWLLAETSGPDATDSPLGRCIGTRGINIVLARIQQALVRGGWVTTRVLAAPQDLASGELALTLVPGRIAAIRAAESGQTPPRTLNSALPASEGELLNLRDIEQGLENLKRLPTADANVRIEPAAGPETVPGQSDLVVDHAQRFPLRATLTYDDSGTDATGRNQAGATLAWDGPLGLNDLLYLNLNHDAFNGRGRGTRGYTAHYSVPWGYWLLSATASAGSYRQTVVGAFETYTYSGKSGNAQLSLSRTLYRDATRRTSASVQAFQRSSSNYVDDLEFLDQHRRVGGWGLGLQHREFIGAATLDLNVGWRQGTGAFSSLRAAEEICQARFGPDSCLLGTSRMRLATAEAALNLPFRAGEQRLRYSGLWRAQWNRSQLTPQDRFAIGGRYTVRGFDGEINLMGERGWLIRNDFGWAMGDSGAELYLGADYGEVGGPSARVGPGTHLAGAVLGLRGAWRDLNYDLFVGTPISKPQGFQTASVTAGFSLAYSF